MSKIDTTFLDRMGKKLDRDGEPPDDGGMNARVSKLESEFTAIKIDLAVIKANGAAKSDIAELRAVTKIDIAELKTAIADAKSTIVMWVVSVIVLAQMLPAILKFASDLLK